LTVISLESLIDLLTVISLESLTDLFDSYITRITD
jgi:hypothetical protein